MKKGEQLRVSVEVSNNSERAGEEIVQLYIRDKVASVTRPIKELKGFKKILLQKGETQKVEFVIDNELLGFTDKNMNWTVEAGEFDIWIAKHAEDESNHQTFVLEE